MTHRVGVTGARGFLGRACVAALQHAGYQVHALTRGTNACDPWAEEDLRGLRAIVHLAAAGAHGERGAIDLVPSNVVGTHRLAVRAWREGVVRFVSAGSALEYGGLGRLEESPLAHAPAYLESDVCEPRDPYGASKLAGMELVLGHARHAAQEAIHLRFCALFGPRAHPSDLAQFLTKAALSDQNERVPLTAGAQVREWLPVEDAANAVVAAVASPRSHGPMIVNVSSGEPLTVRAFAEAVFDVARRPASLLGFGDLPYRTGEARVLAQDIRLARSELGWAPRTTTRAGLEKLVEASR